jgi:hypothetical protein
MQGYAGGVLILEKKKNAAASFCFLEIPEGKGENFFFLGDDVYNSIYTTIRPRYAASPGTFAERSQPPTPPTTSTTCTYNIV